MTTAPLSDPRMRRVLAAGLAFGLGGALWFGPSDLPDTARLVLVVFTVAIIGWTLTRISDTTIALAAGIVLVVAGVVDKERLYAALGHELIWLVLAAFVIAAVLRETRITQRVALAAIRPARSVNQLLHMLTLVIVATAFIVPSTSGRAVVLLPVFIALADAIDDPRLVRALALLFPTVILLSACGSLIGAGAHIIALQFMADLPEKREIDYLGWMILGLPVALVSSHAAAVAIERLFLTAEESARRPLLPAAPREVITTRERVIMLVVGATVVLWATVSLHHVGMAIIGLGAALVLTLPAVSGVDLKSAVKNVEWDLILFLAATILIGDALIESGAAAALAGDLIQVVPRDVMRQSAAVVAIVAMIALLAHLVIVSRSARAAVLIPAVALPVASFGYEPAAIIMLCVIGTGFSQTFSVSSKALVIYGSLDRPTYSAKDLLSLSAVLLPVVLAVLLVMALFVWPQMGLSLALRQP